MSRDWILYGGWPIQEEYPLPDNETIDYVLQSDPPTFVMRSGRHVNGKYIPNEGNGRNLLHKYLVQFKNFYDEKQRDDIKQKIEKCVKDNPQYVNEPDEYGYTPLEYAIRTYNLFAIELLMMNGAYLDPHLFESIRVQPLREFIQGVEKKIMAYRLYLSRIYKSHHPVINYIRSGLKDDLLRQLSQLLQQQSSTLHQYWKFVEKKKEIQYLLECLRMVFGAKRIEKWMIHHKSKNLMPILEKKGWTLNFTDESIGQIIDDIVLHT